MNFENKSSNNQSGREGVKNDESKIEESEINNFSKKEAGIVTVGVLASTALATCISVTGILKAKEYVENAHEEDKGEINIDIKKAIKENDETLTGEKNFEKFQDRELKTQATDLIREAQNKTEVINIIYSYAQAKKDGVDGILKINQSNHFVTKEEFRNSTKEIAGKVSEEETNSSVGVSILFDLIERHNELEDNEKQKVAQTETNQVNNQQVEGDRYFKEAVEGETKDFEDVGKEFLVNIFSSSGEDAAGLIIDYAKRIKYNTPIFTIEGADGSSKNLKEATLKLKEVFDRNSKEIFTQMRKENLKINQGGGVATFGKLLKKYKEV